MIHIAQLIQDLIKEIVISISLGPLSMPISVLSYSLSFRALLFQLFVKLSSVQTSNLFAFFVPGRFSGVPEEEWD